MSSLLTNNRFLSPLKRPRAVRNRSNNATPPPSSRANRLPALPEISKEEEMLYLSAFTSHMMCSSLPPHHPISPKEKPRSRYGKNKFAVRNASTVADECPGSASRTAPRDPSSSVKQMHRSVRLSAFDIILGVSASEPASPVSETSLAPSTPPRPRGRRASSPHRTRSPTPSLTSMSACSSTDIPTTPGASDDEWSGFQLSRKAVPHPPISAYHLAASKSTPSLSISEASPSDALEFAFESFFQLGSEDEGSEEEHEEDEEDVVLWYSRELSEVVSIPSPRVPTNSPARRESLLYPPRSYRSGTDRSTGRSRISKPLPDLPPTPGPSSQMDPTFPRSKSRRAPPPLPCPPTSALPPSPLALPQPAAPTAALEPRKLPAASTSGASRASLRRPLSIVVPRALPRTPIPLDVSDILDDIDAWTFATPSTSTSTLTLSPPRVPQSPDPSPFSAEYDPIELVVSYATQPSTPALSTPTISYTPATVSLPKELDEPAEVEVDLADEWDDNRLRSRWSSSTLASLAPPISSPRTPSSATARLVMHLGSVARRVRARRAGSGSTNGSEDAATVAKAAAHIRSASESALSGAVCDSEASACGGLQRKPIPLELFSLS